MITFATVTTIDDTEFDALFWASLPDLDAGGFVWRVSDDDGVLMLNAGVQDGTTVKWLMGLVKPNAANSKSYLYSEDYRNARNAYWTSIGITSWTLETAGPNTPVHTHLLSRQTANAIGTTLTENSREVLPDLTLMELTVG